MTQTDLFDQQRDLVYHVAFADLKRRVVEDFTKFHVEHPEVYELFKRFAWDARKAGHKRYGANAIIQRIRWHTSVDTAGEDFKINNNHYPCYARLLMMNDPSFVGFFETRRTPGTVH